MSPALELLVEGVHVAAGGKRLLHGAGFLLRRRETLVLLGESGSGKSVLLRSVLRTLPPELIAIAGTATIAARSYDLAAKRNGHYDGKVRGRFLGYLPQEPGRLLHPLKRVRVQIEEMLRMDGAPERDAVALLQEVEIQEAVRVLSAYPHELSGGMKQRAALALAVARGPAFLFADEPTTALDPVRKIRILALLKRLTRERDMGLLLVTHDLDHAARAGDRVAVIHEGRCVETGPSGAMFDQPLHPYTQVLLGLSPGRRVAVLPGAGRGIRPAGCHFRLRCPLAVKRCEDEIPSLDAVGGGRQVACFVAAAAAAGGREPDADA